MIVNVDQCFFSGSNEDNKQNSLRFLIILAWQSQAPQSCLKILAMNAFCLICAGFWSYVWVNSKSDHPPPPPPPPRATPGHLSFLKMLDQIPRYMGRFQGQMPHWLGMKSQNFHNLSGIDKRIVKEIFGSRSTAQGLKSPGKSYASMHPMDPKSLCTCATNFI